MELVDVERRINETCGFVGCPRKTAKCLDIVGKYGGRLAEKVYAHKQSNALTVWRNAHLLAMQRLLCHDIATVCPYDMYDVGLHMVRTPPPMRHTHLSAPASTCHWWVLV